MSNLLFGLILIGLYQSITVINCKANSSMLLPIAKVRRTHPLVQFVESGGETLPDASPIVGGNNAQENEYPWLVRILYYMYSSDLVYLCGGTILNERTILTAAHCCDFDTEQKDGYFRGAAGGYNESLAPAQVFGIEDVRSHRWFKLTEKSVYNDIALLITDVDLNFSTPAIQPVPYLANRKLDYLATYTRNDRCVSVGSGLYLQNVNERGEVDWESEVRPEVQQELEGTNLVNYKTCRKAMRGTGLIVVHTELCAIDKNQGICFGDSGGFTGCTDRSGIFFQIGIPSWVTSRDCSVGLQVFTRVAKYRRWIEYYKYK